MILWKLTNLLNNTKDFIKNNNLLNKTDDFMKNDEFIK